MRSTARCSKRHSLPGIPCDSSCAYKHARATQPLSYTWEASEHDPITRTAILSDTISFSWATPGPKIVTVKVMNAGGVAMDERMIVVDQRIYLPVIIK